MAGRTAEWYFFMPKMYTAAEVVKPPAARATPQSRSKPIQMPHGLLSSRLVTAARPPVKRITVRYAPMSRTIPAKMLNGVNRVFLVSEVI